MAVSTNEIHREPAVLLTVAAGAAAAGFPAADAVRSASSLAGARTLAGRARRELRLR